MDKKVHIRKANLNDCFVKEPGDRCRSDITNLIENKVCDHLVTFRCHVSRSGMCRTLGLVHNFPKAIIIENFCPLCTEI